VHAFGQSSHATKRDDPESLVSQFYDLAQKGTKPDSSLVSSLNTSLEKKGSSFGPQEIANLLWSVAKTGTKLDPKILATVFGLISAKAGSFKPAQIAVGFGHHWRQSRLRWVLLLHSKLKDQLKNDLKMNSKMMLCILEHCMPIQSCRTAHGHGRAFFCHSHVSQWSVQSCSALRSMQQLSLKSK